MRLSEIQLKTFRSYSGVSLNLNAPRVIIGGGNATGKSSLRDAIAWILTGATTEMSGKGAAGELLVPSFTGVPDVTASIVLDPIGRIERQWTPAGQALRVTNWTGTLTTQQQALYDHFRGSDTLLHVLCDARAFLQLDHADAKGLLLDLLHVVVPVPMPPDGQVIAHTLAQLDEDYAAAFEARKVAKRRLAGMPPPVEPVSTVTYHPVETYEARLTTLRAELSEMQRGVGETIGQRATLLNEREGLKRQLRRVLPAEQVAAIEENVRSIETQLAALPTETPVAGTFSAERVAFLRSRTEAILKHIPTEGCVMDPAIPCKTPKSAFAKVYKAYDDELAAMPTSAPTVSPRERLERSLTDGRGLVAQNAEAVAFNEGLASDFQRIDAALQALPATTEQERAIAEKQAHIAKGEGITRDARAFYAARDAHHRALQARQETVAAVEQLEALCDVLGPNGARVPALAASFLTFEETINPYLAPFGWTIKLIAQPWGVLVNNRPAQTYSASERFRIGVALQLAISQASGLSFAIVDELDILDDETRNVMGRMLFESPVEQILILSTRNPKSPLPALPETIAYRLGTMEGRTVLLEKVVGEGVAA